jgi:beta-phosphoglucomutase
MKAVLFDMDGILIDSFENHLKAWDTIMHERFGFNVTRDEFLRMFGTDPREIIARILENHSVAGEVDADELNERKQELFRTLAEGKTSVLPGVVDLLDALKKHGKRIALYSSTSRRNVDKILKETGLGGYFDAVLGIEDVGKGKPEPDGYLKAAEKLGVEPSECTVIEDGVNGVKSGKNAGMRVVGVLTGFRTFNELKGAGADVVVETLKDLEVNDLG